MAWKPFPNFQPCCYRLFHSLLAQPCCTRRLWKSLVRLFHSLLAEPRCARRLWKSLWSHKSLPFYRRQSRDLWDTYIIDGSFSLVVIYHNIVHGVLLPILAEMLIHLFMQQSISKTIFSLTHCDLNKMSNILQTTLLMTFSLINFSQIWLICPWNVIFKGV